MATQARTCSNAECHLASENKCVEGYEPDECPHVRLVSAERVQESDDAAVGLTSVDDTIGLDRGEALDRGQASRLQLRNISRTIALIGPHDSGKTSMIAGLYDLLQQGPLAGVSFAGSSTLIGFEQVCHLARAESRRKVPHMERTIRGADATFFHLDLHQQDAGLSSLFIGDRSGEDYLTVSDQLSHADQLFEVRRADCVTILVNGEQLASTALRHETVAAIQQVVDALIEARVIRRGCRLALVLTKKDAVFASAHRDRGLRDFARLVSTIADSHSEYLGRVHSFVVAASPKRCDEVKRGEGVGELLLFWLEATQPARSATDGSRPDFERAIDRLTRDKELDD